MAPKVTDWVFIKNTNPNDGSYKIEPALVVNVPEQNDTWNQNGDVVDVRSFSADGVDTVGLQLGPATYDDNGVWNNGYALTNDGEEVQSLAKAPIQPPSQENPTTQQGGGVSQSQVQAMIAAGNNDLLSQIKGLIGGAQADAEPAPADPAAEAEQAHSA